MNDLTPDQIDALHEAFAKEGYSPAEAHAAIEAHRKTLQPKDESVVEKITNAVNPPSKQVTEDQSTWPKTGNDWWVPAAIGLGIPVATGLGVKAYNSIAKRTFNKPEDVNTRIEPSMDVNKQRLGGKVEPTFDDSLETATTEQMARHKEHPVFKENPTIVTPEQFEMQQKGLSNRAANQMANQGIAPTVENTNSVAPVVQAQNTQNQLVGEQMANDPGVQHEVLVEQVKANTPANTPVPPSATNEELQTIETLGQAAQDTKEKAVKPPATQPQPVKATRLRGEAKVQADELKKINRGYNQYSQKLGGLGDIENKASSILQPQFDAAWEDLHKNVFKGVNPKSQSGNPEFWDAAVQHLQSQPEKYKDILAFMERNQKDYGSKGAALQKGFSNLGLMAGTAGAGLAGLGLYDAFKHGMNTGDWSNLGLGIADTAAALKLPNPAMIPWSLATHIGGLNTNENQQLAYRRQIGGGRGVAPPGMGQQ